MHARCAFTLPRSMKKRPQTSSTKLVAFSKAFRWGSIESFIKRLGDSDAARRLPFRQRLASRVRERIEVVASLFEQAAPDEIFDRVEDRASCVGVVAAGLEQLVQVERVPPDLVEHSEHFKEDVFGRAHVSAFFGGCAGFAATFFSLNSS